MLTYYCKTNGINYIQGLNELLTPFIYEYKSGGQMDEVWIFNFFSRFMHVFVPTFYSDPEFLSV